jgi:rRNA maturation protein Nop10
MARCPKHPDIDLREGDDFNHGFCPECGIEYTIDDLRMKCPKCGEERDCLSCRFVKETPYETICLKDHYGVTVGEGCSDWSCKCGHEEQVR